MSHVIDVQNLRKTYRGGLFGKSYEALRGVSFSVEPGEIFALLGPNGAGKTTLIKVLLGIVRKTQGSAMLLGKPAGNRQSRQRVGYLPEQLRLPKHHHARTAMSLLGQLSRMSTADIRSRQGGLLQRVGLERWANTPLRKYSKGMLQRLGLAQALLHDPHLLILDEPTDGLDPVGRREVREVLEQLKSEGKTVFINSHLLQEIELFCDRVAILSQGEVRHLGTIDELASKLDTDATTVRITVVGQPEAIEQSLRPTMGPKASIVCETVGPEAQQVTLALPDQAAIDACVDALRQQQLSIAQLSKQRLSLEDAFLRLLAPAEPPGAQL